MDWTGCLEPGRTDGVLDPQDYYAETSSHFANWPRNISDPNSPSVFGAFRMSDQLRIDYEEPDQSQNLFEKFRNDPKAFFVNIGDAMALAAILEDGLTTSVLSLSDIGQSGLARALYKAESTPERMDNLAKALTLAIRQVPNSTTVNGDMKILKQYIVVHWPWMALPGSLVLFGILFLVSSMISAAERHRAVRKSSTIPVLLHELAGWSDAELRKSDLREMERLAKGMSARLKSAKDGSLKLARYED